ncbi:MAG TPA: glycosyltransferase family 4 protein [Cyclobacteriaceae bacterium]
MHVAFIQTEYQYFAEPAQLLEHHFTIRDWAEALYDEDIEVTVIYRYRHSAKFSMNGITYLFLKDNLPPKPKYYHPVFSFLRKVRKVSNEMEFNVIHFHNLTDFTTNYLAGKLLRNFPLVIQDHGSVSPKGGSLVSIIRRHLIRKSLMGIDSYFFCAQNQEKEWTEQGILFQEKCEFVLENSSHFRPKDKTKARRITGLGGDQSFLWVGNLDRNKDPFTVLKGFSRIVKEFPKSKLHMVFKQAPLIGAVEQMITSDPYLKETVKLHGSVERHLLEDFYNSVDFIISASHKEGCGYAVIEAISCGVIPILSRIPSFEHFTQNGQIGALFELESVSGLFKAYQSLAHNHVDHLSQNVLDHFEKHLSFKALAKAAIESYNKCIIRYDRKLKT